MLCHEWIWSQELMKGYFVTKSMITNRSDGELSVSFFSLLEESVKKFQISRQLLDWLHWHFRII
jgi:hypothetical protein